MMGFGMLFMWPLMLLVPLAVFGLPVLVAAWLVGGANPSTGQAVSAPAALVAVCPSCHYGVQAGWRNCPHCGQDLRGQQ